VQFKHVFVLPEKLCSGSPCPRHRQPGVSRILLHCKSYACKTRPVAASLVLWLAVQKATPGLGPIA